jgi:hypothetical protein
MCCCEKFAFTYISAGTILLTVMENKHFGVYKHKENGAFN